MMKLTIVTIQQEAEHDVDWVELNSPVGNMIIQPEHAPMIIELSPQKELVYQLISGKQIRMKITQGIAHITRQGMTVLLPTMS